MHATFLGCVLFCGKFGGRGMIGCFVVGKGNIVRFGLWLDFMFPFGLRFRNPFVSIPLVTFFSVGPASFSCGVFVDWFFCMPLYSFFHFFLMKVVFLIKNACNIPMEKKKRRLYESSHHHWVDSNIVFFNEKNFHWAKMIEYTGIQKEA